MGTSTSNGGTSGKGTPLIPSWLDADGDDATLPGLPGGLTQPQEVTNPSIAEKPALPEAGDENRYRAARTAFTKFARSGGSNRRSLGGAVSNYVTRTSGGSKGAATRMGASRGTTVRILNLLNAASARGIEETLKSLNLVDLVGRPIEDIFTGLADYILPEGGSDDVGAARMAFFQTIAELAEDSTIDLANLNRDQVQTVVETYVTNAIELRLFNEVGPKGVSIPKDAAAAAEVQQQLHDFVSNGVVDAMADINDKSGNMTPDKTRDFVEKVYERSFDMLLILASQMEDSE